MTKQNTNDVAVIELASNSVTHTIGVGVDPRAVAVRAPDRVYVANFRSNTVSVISVPQFQVSATIAVGNYPTAATLTPDGKTLYVANENSGSVSVIDTATNKVIATINVGANPMAIAMAPNGARAYVSNIGYVVGSTSPGNQQGNTGSISVIDTSTNTVTSTFPASGPNRSAVSPDGQSLYVLTGSEYVTVYATATGAQTASTDLHRSLQDIAFSPDGNTAYITEYGMYGGRGGQGSYPGGLYVVNTSTNQFTKIDHAPGFVHLKVTADGARAYVVDDEAGSVHVFDTATSSFTTEVKLGDVTTSPFDIGIGCMAQQ